MQVAERPAQCHKVQRKAVLAAMAQIFEFENVSISMHNIKYYICGWYLRLFHHGTLSVVAFSTYAKSYILAVSFVYYSCFIFILDPFIAILDENFCLKMVKFRKVMWNEIFALSWHEILIKIWTLYKWS